MANYYLDFVGLNTFIYEAVGFDPDSQTTSAGSNFEVVSDGALRKVSQNLIGFGYTGQVGLGEYKNHLFSHNLPNTASFFPALVLHRNGPYGFPTWKQLRVGQNPLTRKQMKNSIFTRVEDVGRTIVVI